MADPPTTPPEPPTPAADPNVEPPEPSETPDAPLGEAGQKALDAWKQRARDAEKEAKRAKDLEAQLADLRAKNMTADEKALADAVEAAKAETRTEVLSAANARLFRSELRAATAAKLNDTAIADLLKNADVALTLLVLDEIPVTDTGDIDSEAISQAVTSYVESRPHLAASATQPPGPIDQGARQTTQAAQSIDEQIAEAEAAGNWKLSGQLKTQHQLAR